MDFADLLEVQELFQYQWDTVIIICLGEKPLRYGELLDNITSWTGERLSESLLTRSLTRLHETGAAIRVIDGEGHKVWALTPEGKNRLGKVISVVSSLCDSRKVRDQTPTHGHLNKLTG